MDGEFEGKDATQPDSGSETGLHANPEFENSMKQFAEGATALTAASIRMQMMMLEQAREMMGDFAKAFGDLQPDEKHES